MRSGPKDIFGVDAGVIFVRFSIGCGSNFRAEVAYLEVGSSDFGIFWYILYICVYFVIF